MKKKRILGGVILITLICAFLFDNFIVISVSKIKNFILDDLFLGLTFISSEIIIFFFLTSLFLWKEHKRKWIFPLWSTLFASAIISFILKISVKRLRPFQQGIVSIHDSLISQSYSLWNFSFPSFQTMMVFCALPILSKEFPKTRWVWILFASLVGFSRLYLGVHYLSDVIMGGLIGYFIGIFILKLENKYHFGKKIYKKLF